MRVASRVPANWRSRLPVTVTFALCLLPSLASAQNSNRLALFRQQHQKLRSEHLAALDRIATFCRSQQLEDGTRAVDAARRLTEQTGILALALPDEVTPELSPDLPANQRQWRSQLRTQKKRHAQSLFLLSRRVLKAGFTSMAFELVRETVANDTDSTTARRLLGFVRFGNRWVTPFASQQLRRKHVWHDRFGWLPATHVERYESGQRYFKRKWVAADREAELRRDFRNAWEIRTDHYLVRTNHSLEEGVQLANSLERFHRFFHASFAGFFKTPEQIRRLFDGTHRVSGRTASRLTRPHVVHYYRDREEYRRMLRRRIPQIDITNGLYMPEDRIAHFFYGPIADAEFPRATLFHEATHQLLYESQSRARPIARDQDFWIVEGFACYMESFQPGRLGESSDRIGSPRYVRFHWARHRVLEENYYIPLRKFASMGMRAFQNDPNITRNYSQASGLAHFLMHHDGGRYRDALIEHLVQIYSPGRRLTIQSLAQLTGVDHATLDRQYRDYLARQQSSLSDTNARTPRQ